MFDLTIVKAMPYRKKNGDILQPVYQKTDKDKSLLPYFHKTITKSFESFEEFFKTLKELNDCPDFAQVLGSVNENAKNKIIRRKKEYFSFYDVNSRPLTSDYLVLDYDGKENDSNLTERFKQAYKSKSLNKIEIQLQAREIIKLLTPVKTAFIVRLSGSFYTTIEPCFRGHIYLPTESFNPAIMYNFLKNYQKDFDSALYRTPNHPIYTSKPDFENDPLEKNSSILDRLYLFDNAVKDRVNVNEIIEKYDRSIAEQGEKRPETIRDVVPAGDMPGEKGLFNKEFKSDDSEYSIVEWLIQNGYEKQGGRWKSCLSDSGTPGLVVLKNGFVYDHHSNSAINQLFSNPNRLFSGYDLWRASFFAEGKKKEFFKLIDDIKAKHPEYKSKQLEEAKKPLDFIADDLAEEDIKNIVNSVIEDVNKSWLDTTEVTEVLKEIVKQTKSTVRPFKMRELRSFLKEEKQDKNKELGLISSENTDQMNANMFLKTNNFCFLESEQAFLITNPINGLLELEPDGKDLDCKIWRLVESKLTEEGFSLNKQQSTVKMIKIQAKANSRACFKPQILNQYFLFKGSKEAINIYTNDIKRIEPNEFVANTFPFTKQEFLNQKEKPDQYFHNFIKSSLESEIQIKIAQKIIAYLLQPVRKDQVVVVFYGNTRSGKSTFKNLLTSIFQDCIEMTASQIEDTFILGRLRPGTRILTFNEFNHDSASKKQFNQINNRIKEISGRDTVQTRTMYKDPKSFVTDALCLLVSNVLPYITDPALQKRLAPLHFTSTFESDPTFYDRIKRALPTMVLWGMELLIDPEKPIRILTKEVQNQYDEILNEIDFLQTFCNRYITNNEEKAVKKEDDKYYHVVTREELKTYVRRFYFMNNGSNLPSQFPESYPDLKALKQKFKTFKPLRTKRIQKHNNRHYVIEGLYWQDIEKVRKELDEFEDIS